jgi:heme/copper-type cytochrome/quinol oxidase subunit 2
LISLFLASLWSLAACGLYVYLNVPGLAPEKQERFELLFWFIVVVAAVNWIRYGLGVWLTMRRRRREIDRQVAEPSKPIVNPEFQVDDGDDQAIRRRDDE